MRDCVETGLIVELLLKWEPRYIFHNAFKQNVILHYSHEKYKSFKHIL